MTKEEFKEMFVECFVLEADKDYDGFITIRICDKDMFYSCDRKLKRDSTVLDVYFYVGDCK